MTSLKNKSEQKNIVVGHTLKYSKTLFMLTIKRNKLDFDLPIILIYQVKLLTSQNHIFLFYPLYFIPFLFKFNKVFILG